MKLSLILRKWLRRWAARLKEIRAAPRAVAGGAAIGIFWAFTPLLGLKSLLSLLFAWIFRCSKLAAVLAVTFHDILTPIWPLFLRWEYDCGYWLLSRPHHLPKKLGVEDAHVAYWLHWNTLESIWPTFIGSLLFAAPSAFITYVIVERSLRGRSTQA